MQNTAHSSHSFSLNTKHNISYVVNNYPVDLLLTPEPVPSNNCFSIFRGGSGSIPCKSISLLAGRGGAYSISIPAAKSSALASMISSSNSISFLRELAMRLSRESLNSASRPWWQVNKYSIILRSRSSAVAAFLMARPSFRPCVRWADLNFNTVTQWDGIALPINKSCKLRAN